MKYDRKKLKATSVNFGKMKYYYDGKQISKKLFTEIRDGT